MSSNCCGGSDADSNCSTPDLVVLAPEQAKSGVLCCGPWKIEDGPTPDPRNESWSDGVVATPVGEIIRTKTQLQFNDRLGGWKVRWGINRYSYTVRPGLYAIGNPTAESPVFVTSNYKLTFDQLRRELDGIDGWLLVLNTLGINVWCAAGKGTFGTSELINRVKVTQLSEVVSHRRLILPQLGAVGVAAHEVKHGCGFKVKYGPILAKDIPAFMAAGPSATAEMRTVRFTTYDRSVLIPNDLVGPMKYVLAICAVFLLLGGLSSSGFSFQHVLTAGVAGALMFLAGFVAGGAVMPLLLPWLPGRSFSAKGAWAGLIAVVAALVYHAFGPGIPDSFLGSLAWVFFVPAVASFLAMNFTGASTYTSFSGVKKEMHYAVRLQAAAGIIGLGIWITGRFV